jgi:hypothetical protein
MKWRRFSNLEGGLCFSFDFLKLAVGDLGQLRALVAELLAHNGHNFHFLPIRPFRKPPHNRASFSSGGQIFSGKSKKRLAQILNGIPLPVS